MSGIFDVSVSSDSEDDADYVPTGVPHSESSGEVSSEDEGSPKAKRVKTKKTLTKPDEIDDFKVEKPAADPKKHAEDIWESFLKDVEPKSTSKSSTQTSSDSAVNEISNAATPVEPQESKEQPTTVSTTKVYEFAGETFTVQESFTVDTNYDPNAAMAEPKPKVSAAAPTEANPKKRGGIGSVLGTLMNKKQKMTTLQKTLYDWKSFKKDEGIEEDLEKFNKGRGGFIERQKFLQRSDVRSFEAEKSVRQTKKK